MQMRKVLAFFAITIFGFSSFPFLASPVNAQDSIPEGTAPIYRFWSNDLEAHFYTQSDSDRDVLLNDFQMSSVWGYEGAQMLAGKYNNNSQECEVGTPAYRFWSDLYQTHFYAESLEIKEFVEETWPEAWSYENVSFCVHLEQEPGSMPVYRFWSESLGRHFYTISESDKTAIQTNWPEVWAFESVVFYAYEFDKTEDLEFVEDLTISGINVTNDLLEMYYNNEALLMQDEMPSVEELNLLVDEVIVIMGDFGTSLENIQTPTAIAQEMIDVTVNSLDEINSMLDNEVRMLIDLLDEANQGIDNTAEMEDILNDFEVRLISIGAALEVAYENYFLESGLSEYEISKYIEQNANSILGEADTDFLIEMFGDLYTGL